MIGRLLNTVINILFLTYIILLISFFFLHQTLKSNIEELNFTLMDTVATTGIFTEEMYENYKMNVFRYGGGDTYLVKIKYEEQVSPGVYTTKWKKDWIDKDNLTNYVSKTERKTDEILTCLAKTGSDIPSNSNLRIAKYKPMSIGDRIMIYLECQDDTLFVKLLNAPFLGMLSDNIDMKIKSSKSAVIGKNSNNLVKGYEVISDINSHKTKSWTNGINKPVVVKVVTEQNPKVGKVYGTIGSNVLINDKSTEVLDDDYDLSNLQSDEVYNKSTRKLGENHIFNRGNYYRQVVEYYDMPNPLPVGYQISDYQKVIEYIQQ